MISLALSFWQCTGLLLETERGTGREGRWLKLFQSEMFAQANYPYWTMNHQCQRIPFILLEVLWLHGTDVSGNRNPKTGWPTSLTSSCSHPRTLNWTARCWLGPRVSTLCLTTMMWYVLPFCCVLGLRVLQRSLSDYGHVTVGAFVEGWGKQHRAARFLLCCFAKRTLAIEWLGLVFLFVVLKIKMYLIISNVHTGKKDFFLSTVRYSFH